MEANTLPPIELYAQRMGLGSENFFVTVTAVCAEARLQFTALNETNHDVFTASVSATHLEWEGVESSGPFALLSLSAKSLESMCQNLTLPPRRDWYIHFDGVSDTRSATTINHFDMGYIVCCLYSLNFKLWKL